MSECSRCAELEAEIKRLRKRLYGNPATRLRHTRKREAKRNSSLLEAAENHRKMWTGPELELASRDDLTIGEVAAVLHRSYDAVRHMKRKLNGYPDARTRMLRDGPVPPTATS